MLVSSECQKEIPGAATMGSSQRHNKTERGVNVGGGHVEFSISSVSSFQEYLLSAELDMGVWF